MINRNFKEEIADNIKKAGEFLIRKADDISTDINDEKVSGVRIYMMINPNEEPTLDIEKSYYCR